MWGLLQDLDLLKGKVLTSPNIHFAWQVHDLYRHLVLAGLDRIGAITCRPVDRLLGRAFGIPKIDVWPVPQEAQYATTAGNIHIPATGPHWPDRFEALRGSLAVEPGQVVLIGAGHLGKSYAHWVKQRGGIGLDVGSIFDAWMGLRTRGLFKEEHA